MIDSALAILGRRLLVAVPTLLVVSVLIFVVLRLIPADPLGMSVPPSATEADIAAIRHDMGFDQPIPRQYAIWLGQILRGDLGISIQSRRRVSDLILTALPTTLELVAVGLSLGILLGMAGGIMSFAWRGGLSEQLADLGSTVVMSIPEFLWAILLILLFGVSLRWLPFIGRIDAQMSVPVVIGFLLLDTLVAGNPAAFLSAVAHLALPALSLGLALAPLIMRVLRSSLLDTYAEDYITLARLRGLSERRILLRHALKNAMLPTVSLIGVQAGFMFGGTLLVEVIYTYPGIGNLMVQALRNHDLPVIQGVALVYCLVVLVLNTAVEIAYLALNPRLAQGMSRLPPSLRRCLAEPRLLIGGALMLFVLFVAIFAPYLAPHPPGDQDLLNTLLPPAWMPGGDPAFPLGTDSLGRCILSRLIFGARVAMKVAIVAALGAALIGTILALLAGYFGGWVDWVIARAVDVWMSFPPVILSLILMVGFGAGLNNVILSIVIVDWTRFCRVVRSEVMAVTRRDYIPAARLAGFTHLQIILKEILPAVTPLLLTLVSIEMGIAVIVEAILSFVGLSVEPDVAAWGVMIADARQYMYQAAWGLITPVLGIFVTVLAANLLGDGLRRSIDPRLAGRAGVLR